MTKAPKKPPPNIRYASEYLMAASGKMTSSGVNMMDLLGGGDFQLVVDITWARDFLGDFTDAGLLIFRGHRAS